MAKAWIWLSAAPQRLFAWLLGLIAWLNAEPKRKRYATLLLAAFGRFLRDAGKIHGVDLGAATPALDWLTLTINSDMVPVVDILTEAMGFIALWHPASVAAARATGIPMRS